VPPPEFELEVLELELLELLELEELLLDEEELLEEPSSDWVGLVVEVEVGDVVSLVDSLPLLFDDWTDPSKLEFKTS
jgi:hypothetical protein